MKALLRFLPGLFCLALTLGGCSSADREAVIADVTKPATIVVRKSPGQGAIHGLSITCSGFIQGEAEVTLRLNGTAYQTKTLTGACEARFGGDWYSDEAELRYVPRTNTSGTLTVKYAFRD